MWIWAEETQINPKEFKKKLFLNTCVGGYIVWHIAAEEGQLQALETLWIWSKEVEINTDELLLAESEKGCTAFHLAAKKKKPSRNTKENVGLG